MMEKIPDFSRVKALFERYRASFEAYFSLLTAYNGRFNLTAITQREEVVHKHFYDSLAGEAFFPVGAEAVEIGSGAGFPSVPLKIVRPDISFTLVESTGKKCEFLRAAAAELRLEGVNIVHARAEELAKDDRFRGRYAVACARAVAPLPTLAEYCLPFVRVGGRFLAYKGGSEETERGEKAIFTLGGGKPRTISYELPEGYGARKLVIAEKLRATPEKYPRGQGKERSAPIV